MPAAASWFPEALGSAPQAARHCSKSATASVSGVVANFVNSTGTCSINPTTSSMGCSSDERLKKNIQSMSGQLQNVLALNPVYFNWNSEDSGTDPHPGFIAQDVQKVLPQLVTQDQDGYLQLGYSEFVPYLVSAIQAQQSEIASLQNQDGQSASANGQLAVIDPASFSGDSVGEAEILTGQTSVHISFRRQYGQQPIVTISPLGNAFLAFNITSYAVTSVDAGGFTISLSLAAPADLTFAWHAFASADARLTVSNGSTAPIPLIMPAAPVVTPPSAPAEDGSDSNDDAPSDAPAGDTDSTEAVPPAPDIGAPQTPPASESGQ